MDRLPFLAFVVSIAVLSYAAGFFSYHERYWPATRLIDAYYAGEDLVLHWQNDLGLAPTRLLVPAADAARPNAPRFAIDRVAEGNRFIAGLIPNRGSRTGALLFDKMGQVLHYWPLDFSTLVPDGTSPNNVFLHGTVPMPDGSVIVSFDNGDVLARIGPCGETVWKTRGNFHHQVSLADDGTLWLWEDRASKQESDAGFNREHIVQVDAASGERLRMLSLDDEILARQGLYGRFAVHSEERGEYLKLCCDPFHPNMVKPLPAALAPAFPMFRAGDLMISLRSLNMVAVLDGRTAEVKWSQIGPWHRQHDPDFLPDGTISVLNNNMGLGGSRIDVVDPATGKVRVAFDGAVRGNFYTWRRGAHQWLGNGNVMIAETERGRAIEVAADGEIVWQYDNVFDAARNGLVNEALVLPENYFVADALSCPAPPAARGASR